MRNPAFSSVTHRLAGIMPSLTFVLATAVFGVPVFADCTVPETDPQIISDYTELTNGVSFGQGVPLRFLMVPVLTKDVTNLLIDSLHLRIAPLPFVFGKGAKLEG